MLIIGERINSTRPAIHDAIKARNQAMILREARAQLESGANYIDVNCAMTSGDELQDMDWVISVIQRDLEDVNICVDSPNYSALEKALVVYKARGSLIINSITAENSRMLKVLPLAVKYKAKVIALTMDEKGMPDTAEGRLAVAEKILNTARKEGLKDNDIYFDPLIRPISTEPKQSTEFLRSLPMIKSLGGVKTICGLSNISFGLPDRSLINSSFLAMAIQNGLDAAILDPLDRKVMSSVYASKALLGSDEYCSGYLGAFRAGRLT